MPFRRLIRLFALVSVLWAASASVQAHNVPSMTIETRFTGAEKAVITINFDPRAFLAADPRTLPPVPASWYRDQTTGQAAATLAKAKEYLQHSLGWLFNGKLTPMPEPVIQPIDGSDNSPMKADTQELHLLATCAVPVPESATEFQVAYAKSAGIDLILLNGIDSDTERRPQVIFPGETSRPFVFRSIPSPQPPPAAVIKPSSGLDASSITLIVVAAIVFIGWRLLKKYRHFHRGHRKPRDRH